MIHKYFKIILGSKVDTLIINSANPINESNFFYNFSLYSDSMYS